MKTILILLLSFVFTSAAQATSLIVDHEAELLPTECFGVEQSNQNDELYIYRSYGRVFQNKAGTVFYMIDSIAHKQGGNYSVFSKGSISGIFDAGLDIKEFEMTTFGNEGTLVINTIGTTRFSKKVYDLTCD